MAASSNSQNVRAATRARDVDPRGRLGKASRRVERLRRGASRGGCARRGVRGRVRGARRRPPRSYGNRDRGRGARPAVCPGFSPSHFRRTFPPSETPAARSGDARLPRGERRDDEAEVRRLARVVEARARGSGSVRAVPAVARARAEVQGRRRASRAPGRAREQPLDVDGEGAPLEAVEDDQDRRPGGPVDVIDPEAVAVRRLERSRRTSAEPLRRRVTAPDRLEVRARKPPRGLKRVSSGRLRRPA